LAALFLYGGVFLGNLSPRGPTTNGSLSAHLAFIFDQIEKRPTAAFYAYSRDDTTKHEPTELQSGTIEMLVATAGNPVLAGLLQTVAIAGRSTTISGADGTTSIVDILNSAVLVDTVSVAQDDLDWREASLSNPPVDNNGTKHRVHAFVVATSKYRSFCSRGFCFSCNEGPGRLHNVRSLVWTHGETLQNNAGKRPYSASDGNKDQ
jgi:hypothetical protein